MASEGKARERCRFTALQHISLRPECAVKMSYGKGHGVTRVSLGAYGKTGVLAVWANKRDLLEGYDIYGTTRQAAGGFGGSERVQDSFVGVARQRHPSVAGHAGGMVVVGWGDDCDGDTNVMLSWREEGQWSEDIALPGADGPGEQTNPSITLDAEINLHAAWVERDNVGGPTRLHYAFGRRLRGE